MIGRAFLKSKYPFNKTQPCTDQLLIRTTTMH